jgi:hypothetical protein
LLVLWVDGEVLEIHSVGLEVVLDGKNPGMANCEIPSPAKLHSSSCTRDLEMDVLDYIGDERNVTRSMLLCIDRGEVSDGLVST